MRVCLQRCIYKTLLFLPQVLLQSNAAFGQAAYVINRLLLQLAFGNPKTRTHKLSSLLRTYMQITLHRIWPCSQNWVSLICNMDAFQIQIRTPVAI